MSATDIGCLRNSGDGWQCFLDATVAAFGSDALMGFVVGSMLILSLYIASSYHPAPPSIGTMLIAGVMIPLLPAHYRGMAQVVMLMGFIVGVYVFLRRYVLEVGR